MSVLRLGVNARTLSADQLRGWSRYTINLLEALCQLDTETDQIHLFLLTDRPLQQHFLRRLPADKFTVIVQHSPSYFLWEQVTLPRLCRQQSIDVLHTPINYGLPWMSVCPQVMTIHDAITEVFPDSKPPWRQRLGMKSWAWRASSRISRGAADRVITVSEYSKRDLQSALNVSPEKVSVIYEAADPLFQKPASSVTEVLQKHGIHGPFFFYVGGWERRKNVDFLIESFLQMKKYRQAQLVLAGGGAAQISQLRAKFENERVHFLGWVPDEELPALYQEARAFIYPSLYEGFGLQLVEAMQMSCPVLYANKTCLPEIASNGGQAFSLDHTGELTELLQRFEEEEFYLLWKKRAKERAEKFDWRQTAEQTRAIYRRLVEAK